MNIFLFYFYLYHKKTSSFCFQNVYKQSHIRYSVSRDDLQWWCPYTPYLAHIWHTYGKGLICWTHQLNGPTKALSILWRYDPSLSSCLSKCPYVLSVQAHNAISLFLSLFYYIVDFNFFYVYVCFVVSVAWSVLVCVCVCVNYVFLLLFFVVFLHLLFMFWFLILFPLDFSPVEREKKKKEGVGGKRKRKKDIYKSFA